MLKIIILDYSILGQHSRESVLFSKNFADNQLNQYCSIPANVYLKITNRDLFDFWRRQSCSTLTLFSILFFQHPLETDFDTSVALNKAE